MRRGAVLATAFYQMVVFLAFLSAVTALVTANAAAEAADQSSFLSSLSPAGTEPVLPGKARFGEKWRKKINWDDVERQLEAGDDADLLVTEDELLIAEMERRRAAPPEPPAGAPLQCV